MAAGLSLPHENIPILRQRLNEDCSLTEQDMTPVLRIEKILDFSQVHMKLAEELKGLAAFREGKSLSAFCHTACMGGTDSAGWEK